ncbi:protein MIS12 homolog [Gadus morhua]|uniref:protein MIS12 homolog n=1 Tax=Gadus morhua TaxID=8049 RepID=UPI0011B7E77E|nr:protein MIS12 homolog [Gadus morhua]
MEGSSCDGVGVTALDILSPSTLKLYEAQFFGFTPQTCMFRIYSAFQDCLCGILLVVEKVCVRKLKKRDKTQDEDLLQSKARECSQELYGFLEQRFQSFSKRMDALLVDKCFSIPPNVLLPGDKPHRKSPRDVTDLMRVESSLAALQSAHQAELCARQELLAELEEQREVREQLDGILRWVGELQTAWLKEGLGSFNENFPQVMESVKKLQVNVAEICDKRPKEPDS